MTNVLPVKWKHHEKRLRLMLADIESPAHAQRVRRALGEYANQLSPSPKQCLPQYFIGILKQRYMLPGGPSKRSDQHLMSDHAFMRALERVYNIDIGKLKELVMQDISDNKNFDFVGKEGILITILPKIKQ